MQFAQAAATAPIARRKQGGRKSKEERNNVGAVNLRSSEILRKDRPNGSPPRGPELTRQFPPHTGREHIDGGGDGEEDGEEEEKEKEGEEEKQGEEKAKQRWRHRLKCPPIHQER